MTLIHKQLKIFFFYSKKELKSQPGVYAFKHNTSGRMYIGSSVDLSARFNSPLSSLGGERRLKNRDSNIRLQRAFAKYGLGLFSFIVLEVLKSDPNKKEFKSKLLKLEQHYIDMISDKYNINSTAGSTLGSRHT
jgi:group I intron endonuclease